LQEKSGKRGEKVTATVEQGRREEEKEIRKPGKCPQCQGIFCSKCSSTLILCDDCEVKSCRKCMEKHDCLSEENGCYVWKVKRRD